VQMDAKRTKHESVSNKKQRTLLTKKEKERIISKLKIIYIYGRVHTTKLRSFSFTITTKKGKTKRKEIQWNVKRKKLQ